MSSTENQKTTVFDPVYLNSKREAIVLLFVMAVFLFWTVGSSYVMGYRSDAETIAARVMGMPSWVFWGVLIPWVAATITTIWFSWFFVANDPLGEANDEISAPKDDR